ncbi:Dimethylaniline monooxygenase [N-oxide-forming] 5-like protein, partial [Leptotrombidium deliense]
MRTGYEISFPFLETSIISVRSKNRFKQLENVFQSILKHSQTLAVIGLVHPVGAIFPIAELHSRWFCLLM